METRLDEIGEGLYRVSTFIPEIGPDGFTFNQFLIDADEPLLFHCGMRRLFPLVRAEVERVLPLDTLRWISFGHVEADELGAMNHWLARAPRAQVVHGRIGCEVSLNDLADRPPSILEEGEVLELGNRRIRLFSTPHVPHCWEAVVLFEEVTATLLCGDIMTSTGRGPALASDDPVARALASDALFPSVTAITPGTAPTLRRLAQLKPQRLAIMHGSSYEGDGALALNRLADAYETELWRRTGRGTSAWTPEEFAPA